jgi:hypothetical protein
MTHGVDYGAMETFRAYGLRDEQEKYFQQMKSQMMADRQRNWFDIPEGCAPAYTSRQKPKRKRGRPPKPKTEKGL